MTEKTTLDELDAVPEPARWCCSGNAEDCVLCIDPNPPYPFLCPGHPKTGENRRLVAEATEATELDTSRRYLRPVAPLDLPGIPQEMHWSVYEWLPMFGAWATGMSLCGESMRQGPLPDGTSVSCARCEEWRPRYERMLAPGYRPEDDDPEVLRHRAEAAEAQVRAARELAAQWGRAAVDRPEAVILLGLAADVLQGALGRGVRR